MAHYAGDLRMYTMKYIIAKYVITLARSPAWDRSIKFPDAENELKRKITEHFVPNLINVQIFLSIIVVLDEWLFQCAVSTFTSTFAWQIRLFVAITII